MAQQILNRPITRIEALELVHDMLLLDTPDYQIRNALLQYGFYRDEIDDLIYEARSFTGMRESNIHPSMMALGLTVVTVIMLLMVIGLLIVAIL